VKNFKLYTVVMVVFLALSIQAKDVQLRYTPEFVLSKVLEIMKKTPSQQSLPEIRFASQSRLKDFQDDVESQWGFRPEVMTNAYVAHLNRIYLLDSSNFYQKYDRCLDDSMAHELVHFVQVRYMKIPIEQFDDSMEWQAVDVQNEFRALYCPAQ
jgi:hypothetical protein